MAGRPKTRAKREAAQQAAAAQHKPMTNAERQAAYRARKRQQQETSATPQRGEAQKSERPKKRQGAAVPQMAEDRPSPTVAGSSPACAPEQAPAEQRSQTAEGGLSAAAQPPASRNVVTLHPVPRRNASKEEIAVTLAANWPDILERLTQGEWPGQIAKAMKVRVADLLGWVGEDSDRRSEYARACEVAAMANLEEAERLLRDAKNNVDITKARDMAYHLRWLASRRDPKNFGDKVDVTSGGKPLARPVEQIDKELQKLLRPRVA